MFGRAIWNKLPERIFEIFKILKNHGGDLSQKSPEAKCHYRLITTNQQTLCIETNIL